MDLKKYPDKNRARFPRRIYLAVSDEAYSKLDYLDKQGKDTQQILRNAIDKELAAVPVAG